MGSGYFDFYELRNEEKPVRKALFAAVDLETTGLYADTDSILEIAAITFRDWSVIDTFHTLIDPARVIPEDALRIHGIGEGMVAGQPFIKDVLPMLKTFIGDAVIVAHNSAFDLGFLTAAARRAEFHFPLGPAVDTCELARKSFPGLASYSLQRLADHFGIGTGTAHRAIDDAQVCMKLFEIECERIGGKDLQTAEIIKMAAR